MRRTWLVAALLLGGLSGPSAHGVASPPLHASIDVRGDDAFASPLAGVRGGHGTADDPYVISDWTLVHARGFGILLMHTRAHVVIARVSILPEVSNQVAGSLAECAIEASVPDCPSSVGIELVDAQNVTITDVDIENEGAGIAVLGGSRGVAVEHAALGFGLDAAALDDTVAPQHLLDQGLLVLEAADVRVADVHAVRAVIPFEIADASNVTLQDSSFAPPASDHAMLADADGVVLERVDMAVPLRLSGSISGLAVRESVFHDADFGVADEIGGAFHAGIDICGTRFENVGSDGVYLRYGHDVKLRNDTFAGGAVGAVLSDVSDVEVTGSSFTAHSSRGLVLSSPSGAAHGNVFARNALGETFNDTIDASANWWNDAAGPGVAEPVRVSGSIQLAPWLAEPPSLAAQC